MILRHALAALAIAATVPASAFDLQGHRGARGLAPENTMAAFERALALGVTTLETDVAITRDEVAVISHDPFLNPDLVRTPDGAWLPARGPALRSLSRDDLARYDIGRTNPASDYGKQFPQQVPADGQRFPTLAQVLALGKDNAARFNIETKITPTGPDDTVGPEAMANALVKVVRDAGMVDRVTIQSFDWRTLQVVQKAEPRIPTAYLSFQNANNDNIRDGQWTAGFKIADHGSVPRMVKAAGGAVWSPNGGAVTEVLVKEAQALGLKVVPWTINNPADMDRLIGIGVDGIITDYPDRLRTVMQARNLPLPAPVAVKN